jgi:hypothetical protein
VCHHGSDCKQPAGGALVKAMPVATSQHLNNLFMGVVCQVQCALAELAIREGVIWLCVLSTPAAAAVN